MATAHCPNEHGPIISDSPTSAAEKLIESWSGKRIYICVLIRQKEKRYNNTDLLKTLLADGFNRLLIKQKS